MKALLHSVFLIGLSTVANTGISIVRNKLLAVVLGPSGVGLFAQLLGLQNLTAGLAPLGLQTGALRYIALYRTQDPDVLVRFLSTTVRLFLWLSGAATLLCLIFLRPLTHWATGSDTYMLMLVPALLGLPFLVQSQTWLVYVQAGLDMKTYSRALMLTSALGLAVLAPLVLIWNLQGAAIHLLLYAVITWGVARWAALRAMGDDTHRAIDDAPFDLETVRHLFRFGAGNLPPFVLTMAFPFVLRAQIVHDVGLTSNGLYQALLAISMQYLAIPLNAMATYSFPRISQLRELDDINREVNNATRVAVLFSAAGIMAILLGRDLVIETLYSRRFLEAAPLFPVQMVGNLMMAVCFAIQLPMLPQERFRARNVMTVAQYASFAAIFYGVSTEHRLWGAVWGFTVSWGIHLAMLYFYVRHVNRFRFTPDNRRLLLFSFAAVLAVAALPFPDLRMRMVGIVIAVAWALTSITRRELTALVELVRSRLAAGGERPGA